MWLAQGTLIAADKFMIFLPPIPHVMKLSTILAKNRKQRQKQIRKIRQWKGLSDCLAAGNR